MPLKLPQLDDRRYADLMEEARRLIPVHDPDWTNHNPSDPGITLLELFAYLTDMLMYRVDRITDEQRCVFLRLLNGPDWQPGPDLDADLRASLLALRAQERAVTATDYERLATDDFNRWLEGLRRVGQSSPTPADLDAWWRTAGLDPTEDLHLPCHVPGVARAFCVPSRKLSRSDEPAPGHLSLILLPQELAQRSARPAGPERAAWRAGAPMAAPRTGHTTTLLASGRVLATGGTDNGGRLATTELYDPAADLWSAAGRLRTARTGHTATRLRSGAVLVAGGTGAEGLPLDVAERCDPAAAEWTEAGNLATARVGHTATLLRNGSVLVVGGRDANGPLATAERCDTTQARWSPAATLATARSDHSATLLADGRVLVAGGIGADGAPIADAERYDPRAEAWSVAADLPSTRSGHSATRLASGEVLVIGGRDAAGPIAAAARYDPRTDSWSSVAAPAAARSGHTATRLADGSILVVGGIGGDGSAAPPERYDPQRDAWSEAARPEATTAGHGAALLPGGEVLIAGGTSADGRSLSGAVRYRPAATAATAAPRPPAPLTKALWGWLEPWRMLTTRHHVVGPVYAPVDAEIVIAATVGALPASVAERVRERLATYLDPRRGGDAGDGWPLGRPVHCSELAAQIEQVEGVDYIIDLMLESPCAEGDWRCVPAAQHWHAEGDLIGLGLAAHHLPWLRTETDAAGRPVRPAVIVAPAADVVRVELTATLTPDSETDRVQLKRRAKARLRRFFHPLHEGPGPQTHQATDLPLAELKRLLQDIDGVGSVAPLTLVVDETHRPRDDDGLTTGPRELIDWHLDLIVTDAQEDADVA